MASLIRDKLSRLSVGGDSDSGESEIDLANKYVLQVTAGPSYDASTHKPVFVNTDTPCVVDNEFLTAKIKVRIRNFQGLPKGSKRHSRYFDDPRHSKDQYSIGFSFVPKQNIPSADLVWGNDFDHSISDRLPPGFNTAFRIVKEFVDPGLSCDAYADKPWLYGPALSCWFAFRIGEKSEVGDFSAPEEEPVMTEGADGSGASIRRDLKMPEAPEKRRKFYLDAPNRQALTFEKGRCYQADFYNPYIDFSKFALKLPGFSLGVIRYINDKTHHLRYVFKNRATGELLFCVVITLLFGDDLTEAVNTDDPSGEDGNQPSSQVSEQDASDGASLSPLKVPTTDGAPSAPSDHKSTSEPSDWPITQSVTSHERQSAAGDQEITEMLRGTASSDGTQRRSIFQ